MILFRWLNFWLSRNRCPYCLRRVEQTVVSDGFGGAEPVQVCRVHGEM